MRTNSLITGLALALTLGTAGVAAAQGVGGAGQQQEGGRRGQGGRDQDAMLLKGITLSADQQAQVKDLADRQHQQMEAERAQGGGASGGNGDRTAREQRREQHIAAVRALLSADQCVQFDKNVTELKARMAERGRGQG
jgi:Spy/CpxP family protein refolding chaperone